MKKLTQSYAKRKRILGAALFGMLSFVALGPLSLMLAIVLGAGSFLTAFVPMPAGILGTGAAGAPTEEETALLEKMRKSASDTVTKFFNENAEMKEIRDILEAYKKADTPGKIDQILKDIDKLGTELKAAKENAVKEKSQRISTFRDDIANAYKTLLTPENVEAIKSKSKNSISIETKSAGTITTANITPASGSIAFSLADFIPTPVEIVRRNPFVIQLINTMRTTKKIIYWVEQRNPDGGAGGTAEGSAKTQQDFDLVEASANVIKFTSYIKVSREMLDDVPYMDSMIRKNLVDLVMLKMDTDALTGTNTTTSLNGIQNQATAWTGGTTFAASVPYANYFDVLKIGINQVATATGGDSNYAADFQANLILMHPTDLTVMLIAKDTQGRYLRDLLTYPTSNVIEIDGVRIVTSTGVPQGYFYIMDATKVNFALREDAMIMVGYENDDFTKNLVTILCETRGCLWIPNNYRGAVVYGNFTTAVASLRNAVS